MVENCLGNYWFTGILDSSPSFKNTRLPSIFLSPPIGIFAGKKDGKANAPKAAIEKLTVSAGFDEDFDYKLPLRVVGFTLSVPGLPDVIIAGDKFNAAAKRNLKSAKSGSKIIITDIKVKAVGNSKLQLRKCRDVIVTVI